MPLARAAPCTLVSYDTMKPAVGDVRALTSGLSRWHDRQSRAWARLTTSESVVVGTRAMALRWQVRQFGAPFTPAARALPWADEGKCSFCFSWHEPHEAVRRAAENLAPGVLGDSTLCVPWHSLHITFGSRPLAVARWISGWNGCFSAAPLWQRAQATGVMTALCGTSSALNPVWQATQLSLACVDLLRIDSSMYSEIVFFPVPSLVRVESL